MRRCSDILGIPWQELVSNQVYVDLLQEARYSNMSVRETAVFFQEVLYEKKDILKKTKVITPGQKMNISKRSRNYPTPPCEMD
jgi:hypothetical protein